MRNETKVGVVVGLLVVVVTSVYFYGSSREDEDVLVGLGRRGGTSAASLMDGNSNPSAALPPPAMKKTPEPARTIQPVAPKLFASDTPRETPKPAPVATPKKEDTLLADALHSRRNELPPLNPSPLPLRSGSSDLLDEATRRNLEPDAPSTPETKPPTMLDLSAIGDRIRRNETAPASGLDVANSTAGSVRSEPPVPPTFEPDDTEPVGGVLANQPTAVSSDGWPKQHRVEYGETLYGIAVQYYGRSSGTAAILKANPGVKSPKSLREGQVLIIPAMDGAPVVLTAAPSMPMPAGRTPYVVRDGDSFYTIAKRVLNDGKRWEEIYDMNKALVKNSPKRLRPGMTIMVPAKR